MSVKRKIDWSEDAAGGSSTNTVRSWVDKVGVAQFRASLRDEGASDIKPSKQLQVSTQIQDNTGVVFSISQRMTLIRGIDAFNLS